MASSFCPKTDERNLRLTFGRKNIYGSCLPSCSLTTASSCDGPMNSRWHAPVHMILTASDGEEELRVAQQKKPDVIVLDMMLPKLGGPQLLQLLKTHPLTASIPVIVLSSLPQKN